MTPAELRAHLGLGPGPAHLVAPTTPPSFAIWAAGQVIQLVPSHPAYPRADVICLVTNELGAQARVLTGVPSGSPTQPVIPDGWLPIAVVQVRAAAMAVLHSDITEVWP